MGKLKELARESLHSKKHEVFLPKEDAEKTDADKLKEDNQESKKKTESSDAMVVAAPESSSTVYT